MYKPSIYSKLYVKYSRRAKFTPRVSRRWRPRVIAWHGPDAFYPNRFYELDKWYKARIQRPDLLPKLHIIDPDLFVDSYWDKMKKTTKEHTLNIGFLQKEVEQKVTPEEKTKLEDLATKNKLLIDLDRVVNDQQVSLADHYNIFEDLFMPGVYFNNTQNIDITWDQTVNNDSVDPSTKVYNGNIFPATNTIKPPSIRIIKSATSDKATISGFNTLLMLNLEGTGLEEQQSGNGGSGTAEITITGADRDWPPQQSQKIELGHVPDALQQLTQQLDRGQLLHWLVANIPDSENNNGELDSGQHLVPYLQPVPYYGTGYHRYVFILFRHRKPIDLSDYDLKNSSNLNKHPLAIRHFNMNTFYKRYEQQLTPSAYRFCLIKWDSSCDDALHKMGLKSPRYWYDWDEPLKPEQKEFPIKPMPFNNYLNMYRNPEAVRKEVQKKRLELLVKLKPGEELKPEYPDIFYHRNIWAMRPFEHQQLMKQNAGEGVYAAIYNEYENPAEQHTMKKYKCTNKTDEQIEEAKSEKLR